MCILNFFRKESLNNARGTMDFATLRSIIGDDVLPESFELIGEG